MRSWCRDTASHRSAVTQLSLSVWRVTAFTCSSLDVARVPVGYVQLFSGPAGENGVSDSLTKVAAHSPQPHT